MKVSRHFCAYSFERLLPLTASLRRFGDATSVLITVLLAGGSAMRKQSPALSRGPPPYTVQNKVWGKDPTFNEISKINFRTLLTSQLDVNAYNPGPLVIDMVYSTHF